MPMFGNEIKKARIAKGLTREELSAVSGVSVGTVITTERGRYIPRATTLYALAKHIDIDINKLLFELEQEEKERKNSNKYPQLQQFFEKHHITQRRYAEILGRSWSYVKVRLISDRTHFNTNDIRKTRDYFHLSPEEIMDLFIDHIEGDGGTFSQKCENHDSENTADIKEG